MTKLLFILTISLLLYSCDQNAKQPNEPKPGSNNEVISTDTLSLEAEYLVDLGKMHKKENRQNKIKEGILSDTLVADFEQLKDSGDTIKNGMDFSSYGIAPVFGNGVDDLQKYIKENTTYPQSAIDDSIEGLVVVQFLINEDGSVFETEILRGLRSDINDECIRVIKNMPDWEPREKEKFKFIIPFRFRLDHTTEPEKGNAIVPKKVPIEFSAYPNPATDYVTIEVNTFQPGISYQLISQRRQAIKSGQLHHANEKIDIANLENGIYILRLIPKDGLVNTRRLVKQ